MCDEDLDEALSDLFCTILEEAPPWLIVALCFVAVVGLLVWVLCRPE